MTVYFDTNIYLYLVNPKSIYYQECKDLLKYCQKQNHQIVTSVETIQEIIHFAKNIKQLEFGLDAANLVLQITDQLIPFTESILATYLENAAIYFSPNSQDILHYSTCQSEDIKTLLTYDKDFSKFKDINPTKPSQFIPANY